MDRASARIVLKLEMIAETALRLLLGAGCRARDAFNDRADVARDGVREIEDLAGAFLRGLGKCAHFVRDNGEASTMIASAGSLNGGVQRQ